jgi:hypothetical protein
VCCCGGVEGFGVGTYGDDVKQFSSYTLMMKIN